MARKTSSNNAGKYKVVCLISGGIDSPVASALMLERGLDVVFVHCDSRPFTTNAGTEKTRELVKILAKKYNIKPQLYLVPHAPVQSKVLENVDHRRLCVICKRMMYRVAEKIAEKEGADAIVTGENLGQVASQTLDNLAVENMAVQIPVLRPLIGYDKNEIVEKAKQIGTYWTSILPGVCCKFLPKFPETHAKPDEITEAEKTLGVEKLVAEAVKNARQEAL